MRLFSWMWLVVKFSVYLQGYQRSTARPEPRGYNSPVFSVYLQGYLEALSAQLVGKLSVYLQGYQRSAAFVATQGPSKATSSDLWHMAWQLNTARIVMLANLTEDGRVSSVH